MTTSSDLNIALIGLMFSFLVVWLMNILMLALISCSLLISCDWFSSSITCSFNSVTSSNNFRLTLNIVFLIGYTLNLLFSLIECSLIRLLILIEIIWISTWLVSSYFDFSSLFISFIRYSVIKIIIIYILRIRLNIIFLRSWMNISLIVRIMRSIVSVSLWSLLIRNSILRWGIVVILRFISSCIGCVICFILFDVRIVIIIRNFLSWNIFIIILRSRLNIMLRSWLNILVRIWLNKVFLRNRLHVVLLIICLRSKSS